MVDCFAVKEGPNGKISCVILTQLVCRNGENKCSFQATAAEAEAARAKSQARLLDLGMVMLTTKYKKAAKVGAKDTDDDFEDEESDDE